ncbi:MAG: D-aminoacyl-tRNA deacylase [bacterium]
MRAILQRVTSASVVVDRKIVGSIRRGLLVLAGSDAADTVEDLDWLADKIVKLRLFPGESGDGDARTRNVMEIGGGLLVVSQFTLLASTKKGTKPSWHRAAKPEVARPLYEVMLQKLGQRLGRPVASGIFGAMMEVSLVNDGPVTLLLDSKLRE